ncbi:hypothetical protein [Kitasatospora sp. NBC_01300]|uniref:hypothetical protein n=1 Tax=Kitasatospora sp. NBC_01300 TaxID=2903574 RepID=UPI00352C8E19|nr:hypothetical protein OG556_20205 [Kitasatospora sp. NBC_01300]
MNHPGQDTIPRPEKTPTSLKAALTVVAADRLPELVEGQARAMAEAIRTGAAGPIHAFVAHWAAVVEIERVPETAKAYHRANYLANHAPTAEERWSHAVEVAELYRAALAAVNG